MNGTAASVQLPMPAPAAHSERVTLDGKGFRLAGRKFFAKGVAYGPFAPNEEGLPFATKDQTARDFALIQQLGANVLRVYHVPPMWLLELAGQHGLKLLVDIPWNQYLCFLDDEKLREAARDAVRQAVRHCARHPAVFAFSVANEIPPDIVRWSGARAVTDFLDELVAIAKGIDPDCLCTFTNYPPTEYLQPQSVDFVSFNVYLHNRVPFRNYLGRLQMIADTKPLVLAEFGLDSLREGESQKCEILAWQIEEACRAGLAGTVVFSLTDDWHRSGEPVLDWQMGLTTCERQLKPSFAVVQQAFQVAPYFPLPRYPRVSVVVAAYNAERTVKACLESLERLNYPDYEIILVDDGSTDGTPQLVEQHESVRTIRHPKNLGLSVARNTGIESATGDVVAFTDADCRVDEDWLYFLVGDLLRSAFAGVGGHNFLPPDDSALAAAVLVSPGGPAHVMLTDRQAEHIPGCNMAFYKSALREVGGFDPIFRLAGDDVDVCWRLQQRGYRIGFSSGGFVWHYRRSRVRDYLKQQRGYGEAEALLINKHPEYFNRFGGSIWRGRIYSPSKTGVVTEPPIIYSGRFGSGWFQTLYSGQPTPGLMLATTLEYHAFVTLPLCVATVLIPLLWPLALASVLLTLGICIAAATQADLPRGKRRFWSRPLVALLFLFQPIFRGWARYSGRWNASAPALPAHESLDSMALINSTDGFRTVSYWADDGQDRSQFLARVIERLDQDSWPNKPDAGWSGYDVEVNANWTCRLQILTAAEQHPQKKRLIRCRLRTRWSLLASLGFGLVLCVQVLLIGVLGLWPWWVFVPVLSAPAMVWLLARQQWHVRRVMSVFLDKLAKDMRLVKLG